MLRSSKNGSRHPRLLHEECSIHKLMLQVEWCKFYDVDYVEQDGRAIGLSPDQSLVHPAGIRTSSQSCRASRKSFKQQLMKRKPEIGVCT